MEADDQFADNVKRLREKRGLTQSELSERLADLGLNFPQQTIYKIEAGRRRVTVGEAVAIAQALDEPIMLLIRNEEEYEAGVAALKDRVGGMSEDHIRNINQIWEKRLEELERVNAERDVAFDDLFEKIKRELPGVLDG